MSNFADILDFGRRLRARIAGAADAPIGDDEFADRAAELFHLQAAAISSLKILALRRGLDGNAVAHWSRWPSVPTSLFKELSLSAIPRDRRSHHFLSSGTTADARSRHWHCAESMELYEDSLTAWFSSSVRLGGHLLLSLTPPLKEAPNSSLVHMFDHLAGVIGSGGGGFLGQVERDGAWGIRFEELYERLAGLTRPVLLVGTAFSFVHVLDDLEARGLKLGLPAGSMLLETGGYKGRSRVLPKPELHLGMRERMGVRMGAIVCEYGMSELSSQAYDTGPGKKAFRFPSWARPVIVSPETGEEVGVGETGLLRIVDLANTFSVMSVQTEDLAIRMEDGFELVGRTTEAEPRGCSLMAA